MQPNSKPEWLKKWHGWEVEAHEYWIKVFPAECVEIRHGEPIPIGWAQVVKVIDDDKEAANEYFKNVATPLAMDLEHWIPMDEADNTPVFRCDGMKQSAIIAISWDGDYEN